MPDKHAKLSPSSAARWLNCPGSIRASEGEPEKSSSYAEEGTLAHAVAEAKLRQMIGEATGEVPAAQALDGEMAEATDFYRDAVQEILSGAEEDADLLVEQVLDLGMWAPESFGTSDAIVVDDKALVVIDFKYGKGVRVDAAGNPQLWLYALGAASMLEGLYGFTDVRTVIIQPRLDHVSEERLSLKELTEWGEAVVRPRARDAFDGSEEFAAGEWCRFCPVAAKCRAKRDHEMEIARMAFNEPPLLNLEEIAEVLGRMPELIKWGERVQGYALEEALSGQKIPGFKVVEGRSARRVTDPDGLVNSFKEAGFDETMLYERKMLGITALEKLCGAKKFAALAKGFVKKAPGKLALAPESDPRKEVNQAADAAQDFKEEN